MDAKSIWIDMRTRNYQKNKIWVTNETIMSIFGTRKSIRFPPIRIKHSSAHRILRLNEIINAYLDLMLLEGCGLPLSSPRFPHRLPPAIFSFQFLHPRFGSVLISRSSWECRIFTWLWDLIMRLIEICRRLRYGRINEGYEVFDD